MIYTVHWSTLCCYAYIATIPVCQPFGYWKSLSNTFSALISSTSGRTTKIDGKTLQITRSKSLYHFFIPLILIRSLPLLTNTPYLLPSFLPSFALLLPTFLTCFLPTYFLHPFLCPILSHPFLSQYSLLPCHLFHSLLAPSFALSPYLSLLSHLLYPSFTITSPFPFLSPLLLPPSLSLCILPVSSLLLSPSPLSPSFLPPSFTLSSTPYSAAASWESRSGAADSGRVNADPRRFGLV